jgi:hypothetical protein
MTDLGFRLANRRASPSSPRSLSRRAIHRPTPIEVGRTHHQGFHGQWFQPQSWAAPATTLANWHFDLRSGLWKRIHMSRAARLPSLLAVAALRLRDAPPKAESRARPSLWPSRVVRCSSGTMIVMPDRSSKRPRDPNALAKQLVDEATGDAPKFDPDAGKDPAAVALGRKGGLKGGRVRAERMTPEQRSEAARKAAQARWSNSRAGSDLSLGDPPSD